MLLKRLLSPKYLATAKKRLYYQSRVDFYVGRNAIARESSVESLLKNNELSATTTSKSILVQQFPFGISLRQLEQTKGKPNYTQTKDLALKHCKTLFYRENLFGVKCILQFHFLDDKFFLGKIELRNNQPEFGQKVEQLIKEKYEVEDLANDSLIDNDKNIILFSNGIVPSITYFTGDQMIHNAIRNQLKKKDIRLSKEAKTQTSQILEMI